MGTVLAFGILNHTQHAGHTVYFRATGCTALTIADVLPFLSKITVYEQEYVIGEMKIWDTGSESQEPNNCAMVRVMVYNDGWIIAWFDKESQNQGTTSSCGYINSTTLGGFGNFAEYPDKWNGCYLKVTSSTPTDPECPDNTIFTIRNTDSSLEQIQIYDCLVDNYHFNTGYNYTVDVYMSNGNLIWWSNDIKHDDIPPYMSNRLSRAIYEMWENLLYSSNTTNTSDISITKAFLDDGGSFIDYTSKFNSVTANDVPLIPTTEEIDDAFYYGSTNKFNGLNLNIGTAGVGNTIVWEYWDGSAWSSLTVTDNTVGFTVAGTNTVTFTPPDTWIKVIVNGSNYYWIRSRVSTASFTTCPLLTQGWIILPVALTYTNINLGMYSFEHTAANYCLIYGIVYDGYSHRYFYSTVLPGKTIYGHVANFGVQVASSNSKFILNDTALAKINFTTKGSAVIDIKDIDGDIGVQNVFVFYCPNQYSARFAAVLITD